MFENYIKVAIRNLWKHKSYTFINITGLAIGMACCFLILHYVRDELGYDRYHQNADRIYRVLLEYNVRGEKSLQASTPSAVGPVLQRELPEIENAARLLPPWRPFVLRSGDRLFQESQFYYADPTIFDMFSLPFISGDPGSALVRPNTIVITETMAQKYFGSRNPIGQILTRNNSDDFEITGVISDIPRQSHLRPDFIASYSSLEYSWAAEEVWHTSNMLTYLEFQEDNILPEMEKKIAAIVERDAGKRAPVIHLQPLTKIHLYTRISVPGEINGNITTVYVFSTIAILLLLIACVNYMNLATARSRRRAREVGMRKTLGALRTQLSRQFLGEAALMTVLALLLCVLIIDFSMPYFNQLSGKEISIDYLGDPFVVLCLAGVAIAVSLIAGSYPAFLLSRFDPIVALKRVQIDKSGRSSFRNRLVVFQFAISTALIVATVVVKKQLDYVQQKDLGFDKDQTLVLPINDPLMRRNFTALRSELMRHPDIENASGVDGYPGNQRAGYGAAAEGLSPDDYPLVGGMIVDKHIVETLGFELLAGSGIPESYTPDQGYKYLINEALMKELGWTLDSSVGKWIDLRSNRKGVVVGVVKDFHYASLHNTIQPLAMFTAPSTRNFNYLLVRINSDNVSGTLSFIEQKWKSIASHRPFEYSFLDQTFEALYRSEERTSQIFMAFSIFTIFIAALGLFGLASFATEQRTKEISIRKVLGASTPEILILVLSDFMKLVFLALIVAMPLAYLSMDYWLQNFAYRVDVGSLSLILTACLTLLIALSAVSYQVAKIAVVNPVKALQYE